MRYDLLIFAFDAFTALTVLEYDCSLFALRRKKRTVWFTLVLGFGIFYALSFAHLWWLRYISFFVIQSLFLGSMFQVRWKALLGHALWVSVAYVGTRALMPVLSLVLTGPWIDEGAWPFVNNLLTMLHLLAFYVIMHGSERFLLRRQEKPYDTHLEYPMFLLPVSSFLFVYGVLLLLPRAQCREDVALLVSYGAVFLLYSNMAIFYFHTRIRQTNRRIAALAVQTQKQEIGCAYYGNLKERMDESRILVHDIKNHLNSIRLLARQEGAQRVVSYVDSVTDSFHLDQTPITNNLLFDVILHEVRVKYDREGISLSVQNEGVSFEFMEEADICTLLMNLLDNAEESCLRSETKKIVLHFYYYGKAFVVLNMVNSCDLEPRQVRGVYQTTKGNKLLHGYGMQSISRVVRRYDGRMDTYYIREKREFHTTIVFQRAERMEKPKPFAKAPAPAE